MIGGKGGIELFIPSLSIGGDNEGILTRASNVSAVAVS